MFSDEIVKVRYARKFLVQVAAHGFGLPLEEHQAGTKLPWTFDRSQALIPGLRQFLPEFRGMSDTEWKTYVEDRVPKHFKARVASLKGALPPEGLWPEHSNRQQKVCGNSVFVFVCYGSSVNSLTFTCVCNFKDQHPIWKMLDVRYEAIAGNCAEFGAGRDLGPDFFSVHFTCMPDTPNAIMHTPSDYESEYA